MPTYVFKCEECEHKREVEQSITKPTPNRRKCPNCKKSKLNRILFAPHVYNKPGDDSITLGLLSDRNADSLSEDQKRTIDEKNGVKRENKNTEKHFWETSDKKMKKIASMSNGQKKKYIEKGEE
jgi:putative FmdB family regulatory protein